MYKTEDYNYNLPEDLIAQVPAINRDGSRLLYVERSKKSFSDRHFFDLPGLLKPGDLLVTNNARVVPARLFGKKESGGKIELLVLEHPDSHAPSSNSRLCLLKSSKRPKVGTRLLFENGVTGIVDDLEKDGLTRISFSGETTIDSLLAKKGTMPLPPYIKRVTNNRHSASDKERYQTVYSKMTGAVAAPTAGLHFTDKLIQKLRDMEISIAELTLYVGHGTFRPVRGNDIREHNLGEERYSIEPDTANAINRAKEEGRRVIAVGTTVVRTLESAVATDNRIPHGAGASDLLITPGFKFRVIDGIITNFHLPKSSLLFLVSAFGGLELIKDAYKQAIEKRYRFYSYGDAMLIL